MSYPLFPPERTQAPDHTWTCGFCLLTFRIPGDWTSGRISDRIHRHLDSCEGLNP